MWRPQRVTANAHNEAKVPLLWRPSEVLFHAPPKGYGFIVGNTCASSELKLLTACWWKDEPNRVRELISTTLDIS